MDEKTQRSELALQIEADKQVAQGMYSNYMMVSHTAEEFILDFIFIQPQRGQSKLGARSGRGSSPRLST